MGYKTVPDGMKDERYRIVNEGTFGILRDTTPNLSENELKIISLEVEDCPLDQLCVYLYEGGVTSICKYAGFYPNVIDKGRLISEKILCRYEDPPIDRHEHKTLVGDVPSPFNPPPGCKFQGRCPLVEDRCRKEEIDVYKVNEEHTVRCWKVVGG